MSVQIEFDLKELLTKLDQKIDNIQKEVSEIKVSVAKVEGDIESLRKETKGDINVLNEKVDGLSKRIDNQEFLNRGVAIGIFVAILGGAAKLFGFVGNP